MKVLFGANETVAQFVADLMPFATGFSSCTALGSIDSAGRLVGGVVFHDWRPEWRRIELSAAGIRPGWLTRGLLKACGLYAFDQLNVHSVQFRHSEDLPFGPNVARLGGVRCIVPHGRGPGADEHFFVLTADAWKQSRFA